MKLVELNGIWQMNAVGESETLTATVPGTVAGTLLEHGTILDPYWRDNEQKVLPVFEKDYCFSRDFAIESDMLAHDRVVLRCDGLDTLAEVSLNGRPVAQTDNMHRQYRFDVKSLLKEGDNEIEIVFRSPLGPMNGKPVTSMSFPTGLRKAACMYGWDWGLSLPDSGIWRDISIEGFDGARIEHTAITQTHENGKVTLVVAPELDCWDEGVTLRVEVKDPEGDAVLAETAPAGTAFAMMIENPQLWWPVGEGQQPLYTVKVTAEQDGKPVDRWEKKIGLRTVELDRSKQEVGYDYAFSVNGRPIYIRGQALVIEDAFLSRSTPARWKRLVENAVKSNLNCIRVWGGAYYPPELFFELCDEAGILIYMDFMFACSQYPADDDFCENVKVEAEQQVKMMASHPSLLLLCGNNEIEMLSLLTSDPQDPMVQELIKLFGGEEALKNMPQIPEEVIRQQKADYDRLFRELLPEICGRLAPQIPYVTGSPSLPDGVTGGLTKLFSSGDMHFYLQYFGMKPYRYMEEIPARFLSEVGFQSYPSMKTLRACCAEEDLRPDSPVMYSHQKCQNGNETIEEYIGRDYIVPENFSHYVYLSQLMAAEIMKFTSDVSRRNRAFNRGAIIWQYNDCWPVVSWAGVDYFGRWKALQYFIKRFFAPTVLTAKVDGTRTELWLTNDAPDTFTGKIAWRLCDNEGNSIHSGAQDVTLPSAEAAQLCALDFADDLANGRDKQLHLEYELQDAQGKRLSFDTALFCLAKEFSFAPAKIGLSARDCGDRYEIDVTAGRYAKAVMLDTAEGDCIFSDNWFDLAAGETKTVTVCKTDTDIADLTALQDQLFVTTLNEVMLSERP